MQTEATKAFAAKAFPTFCSTKQLLLLLLFLLLQQLVSNHPAGDASLLQDYPASQ